MLVSQKMSDRLWLNRQSLLKHSSTPCIVVQPQPFVLPSRQPETKICHGRGQWSWIISPALRQCVSIIAIHLLHSCSPAAQGPLYTIVATVQLRAKPFQWVMLMGDSELPAGATMTHNLPGIGRTNQKSWVLVACRFHQYPQHDTSHLPFATQAAIKSRCLVLAGSDIA